MNATPTPYRFPTTEERIFIEQQTSAVPTIGWCPVRLWLHYLDCKHERDEMMRADGEQPGNETIQEFIETYKDAGVWDEWVKDAAAEKR